MEYIFKDVLDVKNGKNQREIDAQTYNFYNLFVRMYESN